MPWRFQRRIRIGKGLTLNLSKRGASVSAGRRGARITAGRRGTRATTGIPGTGLSYSRRLGCLLPGAVLMAALVILSCGGAVAGPSVTTSPPTASTAAQVPAPVTARSSPAPSAPPTVSPTPVPTVLPATATPRPETPAPRTQAPATPTPRPPAVQSLCGAPTNPWGYNFCGGPVIAAPPANFCTYFACIANFWNGRGYVMQCRDATFSKSGGISGSCSSHGGNSRALNPAS